MGSFRGIEIRKRDDKSTTQKKRVRENVKITLYKVYCILGQYTSYLKSKNFSCKCLNTSLIVLNQSLIKVIGSSLGFRYSPVRGKKEMRKR